MPCESGVQEMIRYMKAAPTMHVAHYSSGKLVRSGVGLAFYYFAPTATITAVSLASTDLPFVFKEVTADFQELTIQGQLTYRVADVDRISAILDFELDARGNYKSEDPSKVAPRLVNATQEAARTIISKLTLRDALSRTETIATEIFSRLKTSEPIVLHGVETLGLTIVSVKPTPETAKALEAEMRETLYRKADEAVYARRNAAVQEERKIKESELNTALAVEQKQREIRESQLRTEIMAEEKRGELLKQQLANDRDAADSRAYALEASLKPIRSLDWRALAVLSGGKNTPQTLIADSFRELAANAAKIGNLNVTPDLLEKLISRDE